MRVLDKVSQELKKQGKNQKDLTDYLGISKNVYTDWKSGKCKSYTKHLPKIAEFLNTSVDYLLGNEEKEIFPAADSDDNLRFALFGSDSDDITKEMLDEIREIALIKREMNRRKNVT